MKERLKFIEDKLYDSEAAKRRVYETGRYYGIGHVLDLALDESNFKEAKKMYDQEAKIVFGEKKEWSDSGLFCGIMYCLLTPLQDYSTQIEVYNNLLDNGFDNPKNVLENYDYLCKIVRRCVFNSTKSNWIYMLAGKWEQLEVFDAVKSFVGKRREDEVLLRKKLIKNVTGLGEKTGSLFLRMCGAKCLIPMDSWMCEILYFHGYPVHMGRFEVERVRFGKKDKKSVKKRKAGLKGKKYVEAEGFTLDLAGKYGVSGPILQLAFWTKNSTYRKLKVEDSLFD